MGKRRGEAGAGTVRRVVPGARMVARTGPIAGEEIKIREKAVAESGARAGLHGRFFEEAFYRVRAKFVTKDYTSAAGAAQGAIKNGKACLAVDSQGAW